MPEQTLLFLSAGDIRKALPMSDAIRLMKEAFRRLSRGEVVLPQRLHISLPEHGGNVLIMPAPLPPEQRMGVKIASLFEGNAKRGLPRLQSLMLLFDATNGRALAILDGATLTAIRTGAASGAATDLLARRDADSVAILGAGIQGRTQLEAVCAVRPIRRAWVFDPNPDAQAEFCCEMEQVLQISVVAAGSASSAVRQAAVVCTATPSATPVFADEDLKPGTHINAIGSYQPEVQEIPPETVRRATIVLDHRASALAETGDLIQPLRQGLIGEAQLQTELGHLVDGSKPGRSRPDEITLFKSVGVAVQDVVAAAWVFEQADQFGLGTEVTF